MKQFFLPLGIFITGMIMLLFSTLFYPNIDAATTQLNSETAAIQANYWGLTWVIGSTRLLVFVLGLGCVLFSMFWVWFHRR